MVRGGVDANDISRSVTATLPKWTTETSLIVVIPE